MSRPPFVDPLEQALSDPPRLPDAGFTAEVLHRLPPRRSRRRAWILGGGATLAASVAGVILARPAGALGPALLAALGGSAPEGTGVAALLTLAAVALPAALTVAGELGDDPRPVAA